MTVEFLSADHDNPTAADCQLAIMITAPKELMIRYMEDIIKDLKNPNRIKPDNGSFHTLDGSYTIKTFNWA